MIVPTGNKVSAQPLLLLWAHFSTLKLASLRVRTRTMFLGTTCLEEGHDGDYYSITERNWKVASGGLGSTRPWLLSDATFFFETRCLVSLMHVHHALSKYVHVRILMPVQTVYMYSWFPSVQAWRNSCYKKTFSICTLFCGIVSCLLTYYERR